MNLETAVKLISDDILINFYENDWENKSYFYYNFDTFNINNICCKLYLYVTPTSVNINIKLGSKILLSYLYIIKEENENIDKLFQEIVKYIYDIPNNYTYSKLLDQLILNLKVKEKEEYVTALNVITHKPTTNCGVCYDINSVLTDCNHNLCRECYYNIKKKSNKYSSCQKCPICRTQIKNYESDSDDYDSDNE